MNVTFIGGPFDGQSHVVDPEPSTDAVIYWPPGSDATPDRTDIPGEEGVVEYIYRGDGSAMYVGGLVTPEDAPRPGLADGKVVRPD